MKMIDNHFEDYISNTTLHPKIEKIYESLPSDPHKLCNLILYGPPGVGKYTHALKIIKSYSSSKLKYEKKICIHFNKSNYFYKISDIHFEIDMNLLGCNSKQLWHEIFVNFVDIISAKPIHQGIILCKNFQDIHSELLEIFYSYMQKSPESFYCIKFILITEQISFIPDNIINSSRIINIPKPSKSQYKSCLKKSVDVGSVTNIKYLLLDIKINAYCNIENKLYNTIIDKTYTFASMREILYEVFIYNLNIYEFIWCFLKRLIENDKIKHSDLDALMGKTSDFLQLYNNNYRPIYHLEKYIYCLIIKINGYSESL